MIYMKVINFIIIFLFVMACFNGSAQIAVSRFISISDSNFSYPSYDAARNAIICQKRVNGVFQLFSIEFSTNSTTQLTFDSCNHTHPNVSKNGKWVAYRKEKNNSSDIFLFSLSERTEANLSNTAQYAESHPSWTSNDSVIVFNTNQYDTLQEISSINVYTKKVRRLSFNKEEDTYGSISPNGQFVLYTKWFDNEKNPETYVLNLSDNTETRITDNVLRDVAPVWITDSLISFSQSGGGKVSLVVYDLDRKIFRTVDSQPGYLLGRSVFQAKNKVICEKIVNGRSAGLAYIELLHDTFK
jgi:Tol biopolymer transport system component